MGERDGETPEVFPVCFYLLCLLLSIVVKGEVVSAGWAMNVGSQRQRQTDNYTVRPGEILLLCNICVRKQTRPMPKCYLFVSDTICLAFIKSENNIFHLPSGLATFVTCSQVFHADKS